MGTNLRNSTKLQGPLRQIRPSWFKDLLFNYFSLRRIWDSKIGPHCIPCISQYNKILLRSSFRMLFYCILYCNPYLLNSQESELFQGRVYLFYICVNNAWYIVNVQYTFVELPNRLSFFSFFWSS